MKMRILICILFILSSHYCRISSSSAYLLLNHFSPSLYKKSFNDGSITSSTSSSDFPSTLSLSSPAASAIGRDDSRRRHKLSFSASNMMIAGGATGNEDADDTQTPGSGVDIADGSIATTSIATAVAVASSPSSTTDTDKTCFLSNVYKSVKNWIFGISSYNSDGHYDIKRIESIVLPSSCVSTTDQTFSDNSSSTDSNYDNNSYDETTIVAAILNLIANKNVTSLVSIRNAIGGKIRNAKSRSRSVKNTVKSVIGLKSSVRFLSIDTKQLQSLHVTPIIVFINRKSGGKLGKSLIKSLRRVLHYAQICDLSIHKPSYYLNLYKNVTVSGMLCCGGDGTVSWIMNEKAKYKQFQNVPLGIVPIGTGNDLYYHSIDELYSSNSYYNRIDHTSNSYIGNNVTGDGNTVGNTVPDADSTIKKMEKKYVLNVLEPASIITDPVKALELYTEAYKCLISMDRWCISLGPINPVQPPATASSATVEKSPLDEHHVSSANTSVPATTASSNTDKGVVGELGDREEDDNIMTKSLKSLGKKAWKRIGTNETRSKIYGYIQQIRAKKIKTMNNYFGIGIDGAVSMAFDDLRKQVPSLFFHRIVNKLWYGLIGLRTFLFGGNKELTKYIKIICDGETITLPAGIRGIIVLNINSYAGGTKLWLFSNNNKSNIGMTSITSSDSVASCDGSISSKKASAKQMWIPQSFNDGILEVVGVSGVAHLGQIKAGLAKAIPLAQGKRIQIYSGARVPMQVDGEPWMQSPCKIDIVRSGSINIMLPNINHV